MSPRVIRPLPIEVVNQIAAGEVISSPAAVVRELVENALDAGATRIVVSLWLDLWRIQVADNGCGMDLTNLRVCAQPHSTSKIASWEDLSQITSLGFRGEALHSLVQLAEVEILSRCTQPPDALGWRIVYDRQGNPSREETVAIAPGTIVTVSDLFGNLPVRRKGLPSQSGQLKAIQSTIQNLALCHPGVTWQVFQDERLWLSIAPGNSAQQILPQLLRQVQPSDLQGLNLELPTPDESYVSTSQLELVVGLPDRCHRRRTDWVKVAVNRRCVRLPELEQSILGAFARMLPRDRFPVCWLHLQTCPTQIDWNRHPAKAEIYLHSLSYWQEQTAQAIEKALAFNPDSVPSAAHNQRVTQLLKVSEEKGTYRLHRDLQTPSPSPTGKKKPDIAPIELQAVAQVRNTYIVTEHPSGLWLIEQHIAHERVLYEQLLECWQLVPHDPPIILHQLNASQLAQLQRLGCEVELFGDEMWAVRTVPALLRDREDCAAAMLELSLGGDLQTAQVATACRSAIRNGTPLSLEAMQNLLDQWKHTRNPHTCPHGRPIYLSLEESSLARFFRRHWVIGKSHGI